MGYQIQTIRQYRLFSSDHPIRQFTAILPDTQSYTGPVLFGQKKFFFQSLSRLHLHVIRFPTFQRTVQPSHTMMNTPDNIHDTIPFVIQIAFHIDR